MQSKVCQLMIFGVPLLSVLFHNGARRHFFGSLAITTGALRGFFDVFVLPLFFGTHALKQPEARRTGVPRLLMR